MANPYSIAPANPLQALMMGQEGYNQGRKYMSDAALSEAAKLYAAGDARGAMAQAAQGGQNGLQFLMGIQGQNNQDRQFNFQQQEATRAQGNADRSFGLQAAAANNPNIQKDENGNFVRINKDGSSATVLPVVGGSGPNNPFAPGGKQTDGEANAALYARRMLNSEPILRENESSALDITQRAKAGFPLVGNYMISGEYQKFDQARRDFINATLRRESGAVISPSEFDNAERQYFPRPGDSKETLAQKQKNRQEAISGIAGAAGKNFKPEYTFGPKGEIMRGAAPSPAAQKGAPVKVSSPQEHAALDPGTQYIAPDGSLRTKQ